MPADLEEACIEQVKYRYLGRDRDPALLLENVYDVARVNYAVPGTPTGGAQDGMLLPQVIDTLSNYRNWATA